MKIKKISTGKEAVPELTDYRYCVYLSKKRGKDKINFYSNLTQAETDINYTSFDNLWSDRPRTFQDKELGEQVARVDLMEMPELTSSYIEKIQQSYKTKRSLDGLFKKIYLEYGYPNIIGWKESFYTNEWNEKRNDYVRVLLCWSKKWNLYVGRSIRPEKKKKNVDRSSRRDHVVNAGGSVLEMPIPQRAGEPMRTNKRVKLKAIIHGDICKVYIGGWSDGRGGFSKDFDISSFDNGDRIAPDLITDCFAIQLHLFLSEQKLEAINGQEILDYIFHHLCETEDVTF